MNARARIFAFSCLFLIANSSHAFEPSDAGTYFILDSSGLITSRAIRFSMEGTGYRFEKTQPDGSWVGGPCWEDGCALQPSTPAEIERFFGKANAELIRPECRQNTAIALCRYTSHPHETVRGYIFLSTVAPFPIRVVKVDGDIEPFRVRIDPAKKIYMSTCALCHATGVANSPRLNRRSDWDVRLRQSKEMLHLHASVGFKAHPPRGGDPSLNADQLWEVVDFMVAHVGGRVGR